MGLVSLIRKAGTIISRRRDINFIEGSNITLTVADNPSSKRVDITIASSGGGSGLAQYQIRRLTRR